MRLPGGSIADAATDFGRQVAPTFSSRAEGTAWAIASRPLAQVTDKDLQRLRAMIADGTLDGPRNLAGEVPFPKALDDVLAGADLTKSSVPRHLAAWRATLEGAVDHPQHVIAEARRIVDKPRVDITEDDFLRLAGLLDADPTGAVLRGPRDLGSAVPLVRLAGSRMRHHEAALGRYLVAWRIVLDPAQGTPENLRRSMHALVTREPQDLAPSEWLHLRSLLDADPDREALPGPRLFSARDPSLAQLAARVASGDLPAAEGSRYFEAWRAALHGAAADAPRLRDEMRDLVARDPRDLQVADWHRLRGILDADPEAAMVPGPRNVELGGRLSDEAADAAHGRPDLARLDRFFDAWRVRSDPSFGSGEAVRAEIATLLDGNPDAYPVEQWQRLRTLLDAHGTRDLALPEGLNGARMAREVALIVRGDATVGKAGGYPREFLAAWQAVRDPHYAEQLAAFGDQLARGEALGHGSFASYRAFAGYEQVVAGRSAAERIGIAAATLNDSANGASKMVRPVLVDARDAISNLPVPAGADRAVTDAVRLLDRNIDRLAGRKPAGVVGGMGGHPDYAEVGEIRQTLALLHHLHRDRPGAAG